MNPTVSKKYLVQSLSILTQTRTREALTSGYMNTTQQFALQIQSQHSANITETQDTKQSLKTQKPQRRKNHSEFRSYAKLSKSRSALISSNKTDDSQRLPDTWNLVIARTYRTRQDNKQKASKPTAEATLIYYTKTISNFGSTQGVGRLRLCLFRTSDETWPLNRLPALSSITNIDSCTKRSNSFQKEYSFS